MPGTVRRIIERIKDQRSGGNSVVALTAETRLVLQGFDPERFDYDTPDDPGRLARIREIAGEMGVDISDIIAQADVAPDAQATPAPPPGAPESTAGSGAVAAAQAAAEAAGLNAALGPHTGDSGPPSGHPLQRFKLFADEALAETGETEAGAQTGAPFAVLMKGSLLMALYSIASDRVFCDQLAYNALYRWFLDVAPGTVYEPDAFSSDRDAALARDSAREFFDHVVPRAGRERLFSNELLQANGRQIKEWMTSGVPE